MRVTLPLDPPRRVLLVADSVGGWQVPLRAQLVQLAGDADADLVHLNGAALADLPVTQPVVASQHSCLATWWQAMPPPRAVG